jgi:hypothetical protein
LLSHAAVRARDDPGEAVNNAQRRLVGNLESQMQLIWADDLRSGAQQEACLKPFVERNVAALKHGPNRGTKLFAAAATELQSGARALSGNRTDPIAAPQRVHTGPFGQTISSSLACAACSSQK